MGVKRGANRNEEKRAKLARMGHGGTKAQELEQTSRRYPFWRVEMSTHEGPALRIEAKPPINRRK